MSDFTETETFDEVKDSDAAHATVNAGHLRAFIERVENLNEEKAALGDDIKAVYAEAKANGFDTKIMRKIVALRRIDKDKRREEREVLDLYLAALGME